MLWKLFSAFILVVVFCSALAAQDEPFLGVWEFNPSASHVTRGAPYKSQTLVVVPEAGGFKRTAATISENGTSVEIHHLDFDANFHQTEGGDPREISVKRIDQRTIEETAKRNRDGHITLGTRRLEISKDGKTMTITASGTTATGETYTNDIRVYDKR